MNVKFPVHCNVALDVNKGSEDAVLPLPVPSGGPPPLKSWQHPGFCEDPVKMVCAMARARNLITRATASNATGCGVAATSILTHVAALASKWDMVAYTVDSRHIGTELGRGPVCAALRIRDSFLDHVSSLMKETPSTPPPMYMNEEASNEHGFVSVVILECVSGDGFRVALPWGKFPKRRDGGVIWDGCVDVHRDVVVNACSMCKRDLVTSNTSDGGVPVKIMPKEWTPATTRPLPSTSPLTSVHSRGKVKKLGKKKGGGGGGRSGGMGVSTLKNKLNEENVCVAMKCVLFTTIIVLSILCIVLLKSKKH